MLPDFPSLKDDVHRQLVMGIRSGRLAASPLLGGFPRRPMNEGDRTVLVRETGEIEERPLNTYAAQEVVDLTGPKPLTLAEAYARYQGVIAELDEDAAKDLEELVTETAESHGNVVDLGGRPLVECILEAVGRMHLLGDPKDADQLLALPQVGYMLKDAPEAAVREARDQLTSGEYGERLASLLERKREENRARENRRKLVG